MYVILIEDRHCDVEVKLHNDKEGAICRARSLAKDYCRHPEDYEELEELDLEGCLFYAIYCCEGDCVSVQEVKISD